MTPLTTPLPVRYGSRDGSPPSDQGQQAGAAPRCPVCATPLPSPRARYCGAACKQRAFRLRQADLSTVDDARLRADLHRRGTLLAHSVYACPACDQRFVGLRRCPDCNLFLRALGLGGACPDCETPILLADLLDLEVLP